MGSHAISVKQLKDWEAEATRTDRSLDITVVRLINEVRRLQRVWRESGRLDADVEQAVQDYRIRVRARAGAEDDWDKGSLLPKSQQQALWDARVDARHKAKLAREVLDETLLVE